MSDALLDELLAKPIGPVRPQRSDEPAWTKRVEINGHSAEVELRLPGKAHADDADLASQALLDHGLNPDEWEASSYRTSEWTMANGETGISARWSFRRTTAETEADRPNIDELLKVIDRPVRRVGWKDEGDHTFVVAIGDMQFGKIDGDGVEGTLQRTIECIEKAAEKFWQYTDHYHFGHVHIAWLGDHIEGFNSQGGANVWRTQLTLNEQIRLTRRVMLHALLAFEDTASRLTMAAVPGNHGEAVRFNGKGLTRYDDSHDTESLIAVADAAALNPERFGHVEFYVPDTDELTVLVDCSGTQVAHAHGHQWKPGKHFDWWQGQAFNADSPLRDADLLLAGHLHHEHIDTDGRRTFIQPPAMESESTWWRHSKGTGGAPGLIVAVTKDGETNVKETIR